MTDYIEIENYILSVPKFAAKNTLSDTRRLLAELYTEGGAKIIHIAGTNGKGSTANYIAQILQDSGIRTALFTSPHLVSMRERIRVDGELISEADFARVFDEVMQAVEEAGSAEHHPSFFELLFLMAMRYFSLQNAEYIVLETGLGGRLDATNCLAKKDLCIITKLDYDHTEYLGQTLPEIAAEKAGILKEGVPVVFFDDKPECTDVIMKCASELNCKCYSLRPEEVNLLTLKKESIDFSVSYDYYRYATLKIRGNAAYQTVNAALAAVSAHVLQDPRITKETVLRGLADAVWPGRFEDMGCGVVLDGAHNPDGIRAFLSAVSLIPCAGKRFLLFGAVSDKRYDEEAALIVKSGLFDTIYPVPLKSARSVSVDTLKRVFGAFSGPSIEVLSSAEEALSAFYALRKKDDVLYAAGSLYLVGEVKNLLSRSFEDA